MDLPLGDFSRRTFTQLSSLFIQRAAESHAFCFACRERGMSLEEDQQLVERVQRGDKRAFDLLVLKYQHKILSLVTRFVRDPHEAQDVAQEAFIKAYRALPNFRGESAFYTWLYRIAINTAKNQLASRNRKPREVDGSFEDIEFYEGEHALKDIDSPERLLLRDEIEATVNRSIQQLPEDLRMALTLREFEGLSYEDIAEVMQCPVGTVRSRIFRAREAVDKALQPLLQDS
jgi:RNA polymerase sigma-70 factor (ECF subfamily)